jgi:hypothetical protein
MITELQKKKHDYQMLSIKSNIAISYADLARKFSYEPKFLKRGEDFRMSTWDIELVMNLINDIINNSAYSLISVSEDSDYLRYHFVS